MTRDEFQALFEQIIEEAIQMAEEYHQLTLPRNVRIRLLHKGGAARVVFLDIENAVERLYFDETHFHWVIDVGVKGYHVKNNYTLLLVIPSGHEPGPLESTWNYRSGQGPFKKLVPIDLDVLDKDEIGS